MSVGMELVLCECGERFVTPDTLCLACATERYMRPGAPRDVRTAGASSRPSSGLPADVRRVH